MYFVWLEFLIMVFVYPILLCTHSLDYQISYQLEDQKLMFLLYLFGNVSHDILDSLIEYSNLNAVLCKRENNDIAILSGRPFVLLFPSVCCS